MLCSTIANNNVIVYHQAPVHSIGIKLPSRKNNFPHESSPPLPNTNSNAAFLPTQTPINADTNDPIMIESNEKYFIKK